MPAHRVRLGRKVQRVLKDQWVKRAKPAPLVPPVQWDHKALPVRKVLLVLRVRLACRGLRTARATGRSRRGRRGWTSRLPGNDGRKG